MATSRSKGKKNITLSLDRQLLKKAMIVANRRGMTLRGFLGKQIELLTAHEEGYERAKLDALALLERGFHMGGIIRGSRDQWHERCKISTSPL